MYNTSAKGMRVIYKTSLQFWCRIRQKFAEVYIMPSGKLLLTPVRWLTTFQVPYILDNICNGLGLLYVPLTPLSLQGNGR